MIDIFEIEDFIQQLYEDENGELPDPEDFDSSEYIYRRYGCDYESFASIIDDLINYTPLIKSPLTGEFSHCFGKIINPETGLFCAIIDKKIDKTIN